MERKITRHLCLALLTLVVFTETALAELSYVVTDIGSLGGNYVSPYSLNNLGHVVGTATDSNQDFRPFYYDGNSIAALSGYDGQLAEGAAFDVNDHAQVVGRAYNTDGKQHAFLWEYGQMNDLGVLDPEAWEYPSSVGIAINNEGTVVGESTRALIPGTVLIGGDFVIPDTSPIFVEPGGQIQSLGYTLDGDTYSIGAATGINSSGQITGSYSDFFTSKAFLYENGVLKDIGHLGGGSAWASDINDNGQIVGYSENTSGETRAFIYENGAMSDLGVNESEAYAINNQGDIVGIDWEYGVPWVRRNGEFYNINTLLPQDWFVREVRDINDSGQILAVASQGDNDERAVLLTPQAQVLAPEEPPLQSLELDYINVVQDVDTTQDILTYAFPVQSTDPIWLNVEAGGNYFLGGTNPTHESDAAYYSLDIDVNSGDSAEVLTAKTGIVRHVSTDGAYEPVIVIDHGQGYYTEYREFEMDDTILTTFESMQAEGTDWELPVGSRLGELNGIAVEHLHFQVEYDPNWENVVTYDQSGLSSEPNPANPENIYLRDVTIGGLRFNEFSLTYDENGDLDTSGNVETGRSGGQGLITNAPAPEGIRDEAIPVENLREIETSDTGIFQWINDQVNSFVRMITGSPVYGAGLIDLEGPADTIIFDTSFLQDSEGLLSVYWEGELIGVVDAFSTSGEIQTFAFSLPGTFSDVRSYSLGFRLDPYDDQAAAGSLSVDITDIAFTLSTSLDTIPEPSTVLMAFSAICLLTLRRTHR